MRKLLEPLKSYKLHLIVGPFFKLIEAILELMIPTLMVYVIDNGVKNKDTGYIIRMGFVMLLIAAIGLCSALICQYFASLASQGYGAALRKKLFSHINGLSYKELDTLGTSSLVNRITNDVNVLQQAVAMFIRLVIRAPFICIGSVVMAMMLDLKLSLIILACLPVLSLVIFVIMSRIVPRYKKVQKNLDELSVILRENLSGVKVIRAFARRSREIERFNMKNEEFAENSIKVGRISALLSPITTVIMNFAIIAIIWFGGLRVNTGNMSQGEMIAFINYVSYMVAAMLVIANLVVLYTRAAASAMRVREVLDTQSSITDSPDYSPSITGNPDCAVEFKNVSFAYNTQETLKDISFSLKKGETLGIIGATGSGKSSLINLIPRFYDVSSGAVFVNGIDVRQYKISDLRSKISIVNQKASLLSGTVADNIRQGNPNATDAEVEMAARLAQASTFIERLPLKYQSVVERDGANFSGGQKQRLSIARALVRNPEILILDDSSSALDYSTDASIRSNLRTISRDMIQIIVTQRAESISHADYILVLDCGDIVGFGKHHELYESCPIYREICDIGGGVPK